MQEIQKLYDMLSGHSRVGKEREDSENTICPVITLNTDAYTIIEETTEPEKKK